MQVVNEQVCKATHSLIGIGMQTTILQNMELTLYGWIDSCEPRGRTTPLQRALKSGAGAHKHKNQH